MPMRCTAPDDAASGSSPRRTLRRMSSMKWIESQVPTTRASEGTTLVSTVTGAPSSPSAPRAQTAPTNGGTQATTVDRRLRATAAERITASDRPMELNVSMSRRNACIACSRRAGRPVSSTASGPRSSAASASAASTRATTSVDRGGRSASAASCTSRSDDAVSAESRWPATSGCREARALASARASASSGPLRLGITGRIAPAAPCRRISKMLRTCSTPSTSRRRAASDSRAASGSASKMSPVRAVARTMQSRSGGPKIAATSSTRANSPFESRISDRRSSSSRSREIPNAARAVTAAASSQPARCQDRDEGAARPAVSRPSVPRSGGVPPGPRSILGTPGLRSGRESPRRPASSNRSGVPRPR